MRVAVVGLGYVGLVTAGGLAEWRHEVVGVDVDEERLAALRAGHVPLFEPGLDELVAVHTLAGRLDFSSRPADVMPSTEVVFIAVGTHDGNGGWQTDAIFSALHTIVPVLPDHAVVVVRSTLPPASVHVVAGLVARLREDAGRRPLPIMTNPEFTREGQAVRDFLHPDRIVLGIVSDDDGRGTQALQQLYGNADAPILVLNAADAAMAKLGSNLFLATKISFANELAALCETYGADVEQVVGAMAHDPRIGGSFLRSGIGFGGSCLPHQVTMTVRSAAEAGVSTPLLAAVEGVNHGQRIRFVDLLDRLLGGLRGRRVALLGLTFKPDTDDLRDAPSLPIARRLIDAGASVVAYDPMVRARELARRLVPGLGITDSARSALEGADGAGLVTEWPELLALDWRDARSVMRGDAFVDGRNALSPDVMGLAGFRYRGFGRRFPTNAEAVDQPLRSAAVETIAAGRVRETFGSTAVGAGARLR
jgi:UDPglucose 6-dehydrogenase